MTALPSVLQTFDTDMDTAKKFLRGEPLSANAQLKGYTAVTFEGLTLGFGKASGGIIKNHLPHGLRLV